MLSFQIKFVQTGGQMDRQIMVKLYVPDLPMLGHKRELFLTLKALNKPNGYFYPTIR